MEFLCRIQILPKRHTVIFFVVIRNCKFTVSWNIVGCRQSVCLVQENSLLVPVKLQVFLLKFPGSSGKKRFPALSQRG